MAAIDPKAAAVAKIAGITHQHAVDILREVSQRNPALLIGGYHVDAVIISPWLALQHEATEQGLSDQDIYQRIDEALTNAWGGLI